MIVHCKKNTTGTSSRIFLFSIASALSFVLLPGFLLLPVSLLVLPLF